MLIHVFLLRKNPGEWQNHKCTHFNIINIIWLPLCSPQCPGFYLPMAAEEESENRFYIPCAGSHPCALPAWQKSNSLSSQTRQTGTETRNSSAFTQETSPEWQQTCSKRTACALSPTAKSCHCHGPAGRRSGAAQTLSPSPMALPWIYFLPSEQTVAWAIKPGNNLSWVVLNMTKSCLACSNVRLLVFAFIHPLFISLSRKRLVFASSRREILRLLKL